MKTKRDLNVIVVILWASLWIITSYLYSSKQPFYYYAGTEGISHIMTLIMIAGLTYKICEMHPRFNVLIITCGDILNLIITFFMNNLMKVVRNNGYWRHIDPEGIMKYGHGIKIFSADDLENIFISGNIYKYSLFVFLFIVVVFLISLLQNIQSKKIDEKCC